MGLCRMNLILSVLSVSSITELNDMNSSQVSLRGWFHKTIRNALHTPQQLADGNQEKREKSHPF